MTSDAATSTSLRDGNATASTAAQAWGVTPPGYQLPDGIRLGRVVLQVADLPRSVAYYERVLGLRVSESAEGVAVLAARDDDRPLVELRERSGASPVPRRGSFRR